MNGNHKQLNKYTVYNWFSRYEEQTVDNQENSHFPEQKNTGQAKNVADATLKTTSKRTTSKLFTVFGEKRFLPNNR